MSFITGVGLTAYGKHVGSSSLDLMSTAAQLAISDAGLKRGEILSALVNGLTLLIPALFIVVEGIETEQQAEHVRRLAPQAVGQGWLLGRPAAIHDLPAA